MLKRSHRILSFVGAGLALATLPIGGGLSIPSAQARPLHCEDLPELFKLFLRNHYAYSSLTEEIKAHTVERFIKALDPSKTTLLEADVAKLRVDLLKAFGDLQGGNCALLNSAYTVLNSRVKENEVFVKGFLNDSYKLDESIELIIDPDKRAYPKNAEEKQALLKKMVHFQISNYLLTKMKLDDAKKQLIKRYELLTKRAEQRKPDDPLNDYAEAFATALDPHSSFLPQDVLEDFQIQMQLSLEGIGASLSSEDGYTVVEETIPGGGAEKSKMLKPKDKIIAVAQEGEKAASVIDMDLRDVVKLIRGKKGTKVTLTILRQGDKTETFPVTIVRDKIDLKEQAAKISYETRKVGARTLKIGVIDLPSFYGGGAAGSRSAYNDMKDIITQAVKKEKVDGLVLDLSRNGGGLLDDAVRISGLFIKKGGVVATQDTAKRVDVLADEDPEVNYTGPLVILTSRLSASASEILAGALHDYHRAVIVGGDHTFGKGTVQVLRPLPDNIGAMKVTTGMFFIPKGASTQHLGVASDIVLPSVFGDDEIGEKTLSYSLKPQTIGSFVSTEANPPEGPQHWKPIDGPTVAKLGELSKARVTKDPKFQEIEKEIVERNKNKGIVKLSEIRKKSEADKKKETKDKEDDKKKKGRKHDLDSPYVREGVNILVDLASQGS